jgi:diguanylate cyclase
VTIKPGTVDSVEALVRWAHPRRGLLPPDMFVPAAEQTDLIERLTGWALTRALGDLCTLVAHAPLLRISVNVSAHNLARPGFAQRVAQTLARAGVPADRLTIELTETALVTDPARAAEALSGVTAIGASVSIDDFGIGQTSLGYLSRLPVDELKIDRSFVAESTTDPARAAIVHSIVELGHNLGLSVVAEGVETEEVLGLLRILECDGAQGYLFARPMPLEQLVAWLGARDRPAETVGALAP